MVGADQRKGPGLAATVASTRISAAERAVLVLIQSGCSNKEIASLLGKAEPTVKHQVSSILRKTGQPSRARLMAALGRG